MPSTRILVVDDDIRIRRSIEICLESQGFEVILADNEQACARAIAESHFDLLLVDIRLGQMTGLELVRGLRDKGVDIPVIFMSGHASLSEAAESIKIGAVDFLEKPIESDRLLFSVRRGLEVSALKRELTELRKLKPTEGITGQSPDIIEIRKIVSKTAKSKSSVLIQGESGTGKDVVARMIHAESDRSASPFVKVNCAAIPENLIESELFGYEKGAFTGALHSRRGFFEQANSGTLFLDEVGDMSLSVQSKILRAIQNFEVQRLGSERVLKVDVRLIVATNKNLKTEVAKGRFREDLFYRLFVVGIDLPPLRKRMSDVPALIQEFLKTYAKINAKPEREIAPDATRDLMKYDWPGNVRELFNSLERLLVLGDECISAANVKKYLSYIFDNDARPREVAHENSLVEFLEGAERRKIVETLEACRGNVTKAAERLKIERTTLHKKMAGYEIQKGEFLGGRVDSARNTGLEI